MTEESEEENHRRRQKWKFLNEPKSWSGTNKHWTCQRSQGPSFNRTYDDDGGGDDGHDDEVMMRIYRRMKQKTELIHKTVGLFPFTSM